MKKLAMFLILFGASAADAGGGNSFNATITNEYSLPAPPQAAIFNVKAPDLVAVVDHSGTRYILNLADNNVMNAEGLIGFIDIYAAVVVNPNLPEGDIELYDPYKWNKTDIQIRFKDGAALSSDSGDVAIMSIKLDDPKPGMFTLRQASSSAPPQEKQSPTNKISDAKGRIRYIHDKPLFNPIASHDGNKYIFQDQDDKYYLVDILTGMKVEIPLSFRDMRGKAVQIREEKTGVHREVIINDIFVDARWFRDDSTIFIQQRGEDHDGAVVEESSYIYEMLGNRLSQVNLPEKITSRRSPSISIGDISTEGNVVLLKDKVYIIKIDWNK